MSKKGFTLLEVIIATSVAIVTGILLLLVILNSTGLSNTGSVKVEQGVGLNDALSSLRRNVKESSSIASSYPESGIPEYSSSPTQLVLKISSLDSEAKLVTNKYDYFIYIVENGKLTLRVIPDGASSRYARSTILSLNVENINFQYFNNATPPQEVAASNASKVRFTMTLRQKSNGEYRTLVETSEANLRNM